MIIYLAIAETHHVVTIQGGHHLGLDVHDVKVKFHHRMITGQIRS